MPNLKAAKKALRHSQRRRAINDKWRRRAREAVKTVRDAITKGDAASAAAAWPTVQRLLDRATRRHVLHPRQAARQKSRLQSAIQKIGATK